MFYICFFNWVNVFLYSILLQTEHIKYQPLKSCDLIISIMLNWVSTGFLISLDLWYNLIFVCRIQCFIPFCSARQKFFFFFRIQWLIPFCSFLFLCRIERVKPFCSLLFLCSIQWFLLFALLEKRLCFSAEQSDLYQSADLDKSYPFSSGSNDLYHSALWDKSFSFSAGSSDLYHIALLYKTCFFMAGSICA